MARREIHIQSLTHKQMNSGDSYRVRFSYGTFPITAKKTKSGTYYYIVKRVDGELKKRYLGKCGHITMETLHRGTMNFLHENQSDCRFYLKSNRGSQ